MAIKLNESVWMRLVLALVTAFGLAAPSTSSALDFEFLGINATLDSNLTFGAAWRMEERNPALIGKSNLNPGLCTARRSDDSLGNREDHTGSPQPGNIGNTCNVTTDGSYNAQYVQEPGFFSSNSDNGNLNYEKGEMVSGVAKYVGDLNLSMGEVSAFIRGIYFFDAVNDDFDQYHPDTTLQPRTSKRSPIVQQNIGTDFDILDAYITYGFDFMDRYVSLRVGDQVINWGESAFLIPGSLNSINPPDVTRLRIPGFDVKELFLPTGMIYMSTDLSDAVTIEAMYMYEWEPVVPDAAGSFWSTSDIAGGGTYAMLSFGKAPEDPNQSYDTSQNPNDAIGLISSASRTLLRGPDFTPEDEGGQFGVALKYFAEDLNGGTEFGGYYMKHHARFPIASFTAANATCIGNDSNTVPQALADCGLGGPNGRLGAGSAIALLASQGLPIPPQLQALPPETVIGLANDPLPVDTATVHLEYPEDLEMMGISFNTLLGDWAWSGEVAYRPEDPLQIHTVDLVYSALQPAFPNHALAIPGVGNLPNRRLAIPDYNTAYKGREPGSIQPGEVVHGYAMLPTYNYETTFLRTIGGDNFLKADQIIVLMEMGAMFVDDMPDITELQLNGAGAGTHFSNGADGTLSPRDNADLTNSSGDGVVNTGCGSTDDELNACRQNPTQQSSDAFATEWSYGYRLVSLLRYQDAIFGINLEPLIGVFHDVAGISPGPGGNFIEDRVTTLIGLRFDYLSKWNGEIRYTDYSGGGVNHQQNDRDYLQIWVGYQF